MKEYLSSESLSERESSFDEMVILAQALDEAVDKRNLFILRQGGFDTFAEVGQHVEGMRAEYDKMEDEVFRAREEFDSKVSDKNEFFKKLRDAGNNDLADRIEKMFGAKKEGIFSRIFKK